MVARTSAITVKIKALLFMVPSLSDEITGKHYQGTGQAFWKEAGINRSRCRQFSEMPIDQINFLFGRVRLESRDHNLSLRLNLLGCSRL
jgi:hypothetical protein